MANNENLIPIPGRLHSVATEGHVAGADEIYDDTQSKLQSAINADVAEDISDLQEIVGEGSVDTRIENAIKALDAEKSQTAGADGLALSVTEVDGKITSISGSIATDTYDSYGSASAAQEAAATDATTKVNAAKAELLGDAATDYNTLGKLEDAIQSEASARETEIGTDSTAGSVKGRIKSLETLVGSTDVDSQIDAKINALDSTKSQTAGADGLALSIEEEDGKIKSISGSIAANTYDAYGAASTAKSDLLGDAASDYNTLGKLEDAIQAEVTTRSGETEALDGRLDDIEEVIPSAASSSNQLADKSFVNSSISTATAEFQGSYNSVSDLELTTSATHAQIATALGTEISGADNNDYCFVQIPTADVTPTDIAKVERYKYNGTDWSFEYELNNSGYTDAQWAAINSGITSNLVTAFGNKYDKPSTGIPSTDMTSDVQTSLGKADSAYQKPSGGIPDSDLTSAVQTSLGKADTAYQKPSEGIPSSDLAEGVIPDISGKANKSEMSVVDGTGADADKTTITLKDGTSATVLKSHQDISGKQDVIDSTHKLAADLVDDTSSTNKFTNATEKQTWNAKQDALTFNTTPSADNKVATMADIEDATENCAYLEEDDSSAVIADFDPQADTVWKKAQTLSNAEKSQVKTNLGLPQEIYSKTEVNNLITTPNQQYVTVATYASLPASGSADTIYRVSNYNGSTNQVDATMYSEYAWNGSDYTFLCVKSQIGEVFDITAYNSNTKYADLATALGTNGANVPEGLRKGGMNVKYVSNSDNKYVQYLCIAASFSTNPADWEKMNLEKEVSQLNQEVFGISITQPTQADKFNGYVNSSGGIISGANYCVFVDVSKLNGFHITQLTTTPGDQYAFLKSKGETSVEFVDGTGRVDAQLNNTLVPDGAVLLYILLGSHSYDAIPYLSIDEGETKPIREELEKKQDVIVDEETRQETFSKDSPLLEYVGNYYQQSDGALIEYPSMHLYQFVAEDDIDLWWVSQTSGNDVILAIYIGEATKQNFISPRYRNNGSTNTLPTSENKLHVAKGRLVTISYETGDFVFAYTYAQKVFKSGILLSEEQVAQAQGGEIGKISVSVNSDYYGITINGYNIRLIHYVNAGRNADCWTINEINKNGNVVLPSGTDVVGVLKEKNQDNFMGGYAHGNEQIVDFHILADGNAITENVNCNTVDVFMYSHLYRVSNPAENIIDRYTHINFKDGCITIETTFKCLVDNFQLDIAYNGGMWAWRQSLAQFATTNIGLLTASGSSGTSIFGLKHELISASALLGTGLVSTENLLGFEQSKFKGEAYYYGNEGATARMKIYYSTDDNSTWESGHLCVGKARYTLN